jgi:hypothetical protein
VTKTCSSCKGQKLAEEFNQNSTSNDGLQPFCRSCQKEHAQRNYRYNKDDLILQVLSWQFDNIEKVRAYKRKYKEYEKSNRKTRNGGAIPTRGRPKKAKENREGQEA